MNVFGVVFACIFVVIGYGTDLNDIIWDDIDIGGEMEFNEFRNINGYRNNIGNPLWGNAFAETVRCVDPAFGDGFNSLAGCGRLNPREISNVLFRQYPEESPIFVNDRDLTQFAWQWGQFIDHDITLISEDRKTDDLNLDIDIYVPCCDVTFDIDCACDADIVMNVFRTAAINGTGTGPDNPRKIFNDITSFVDGSMVYGSDDERANELRSFSDGLLRVTITENGEELLPLNINGIPNEPNDGEMFFIGGDVRANEQTGLLTMHTLFNRAHNIIAQAIINGVRISHPRAIPREIDELTYQYTKLILTGIIQKITYKDWLPTLFGPTAIQEFLGDYMGYDSSVNPGMCAIFSSSAFRLGHTLLPQRLPRRTGTCDMISNSLQSNKDLPLREAFFVPEIVIEDPETINEIVNGFGCTLANEIDTRVTDGVRDFLFASALDANGDSIFGILDLISLNLKRGRDHGLPDYNTVREMIGLPKHTSFDHISSNAALNKDFRNLYNKDIDNIDLFGGLLAEDHFPDGSFGETISKIVLSQFKRTRDGDRFWYENYIKKGCLRSFIESVTLKDILEWTTNMDIETLDANENIFQNTRAVSIFETHMYRAEHSKNNILSHYNIKSYIDILMPNIVPLSIIFVLICIISLLCGSCVAHKLIKRYNNNPYKSISYDSQSQISGGNGLP